MTKDHSVDVLIVKVENYLKTNNMSMREFCKINNIHPSILSRFLRGQYRPGLKTLSKINIGIEDFTGNVFDGGFEQLSIDELTDLINKLTIIRKDKIQNEMKNLHSKLNNYQKLLSEES